MKVLTFIILLVSSTFAQMDSDAIKHEKDAVREAWVGTGFLAATMISIPIEDYLCNKYNVSKDKQETIKILSGIIFGSITLYYAGRANHDMAWVQYKVDRVFSF